MKEQDRRSKRTKRMLKNALIELLKTKNINQISVRELSELADINRATFYLHYKTPHDFLLQLEDELFNIIFTSYKNHDINNQYDFLLLLYKCIGDNYELLKVLLNSNTGSTFWDKLSDSIKAQYSSLWSSHLSSLTNNELQYYANFIIDGYVSVIKSWLLKGRLESPAEMVELSMRFQYKII
ncbi:TetR/AcrR family transcriptional regulator [Clostridium hydrogenum]|uniref:TetR/AcrR family transcriptional regulator n=1 Tax=Clostridium hydrogenum TaxID=2855764 RepID=UPI001F34D1BB|nr:TetR/AcrR family transcriptional regulator [Clostridium hydrogenum]